MEQEKSVAKVVTEIIDSLPLMADYLLGNIINYNGLARWILPEVERRMGKQVSVESVSVAIQRYHFKGGAGEVQNLTDAIAKTKLILKNDIANIAYLKNFELIKRIDEYSERVMWEYGETFFTVQSTQELSVVLEHEHLEGFLAFTKKHAPLSVVENVTIITCKYPEHTLNVPGYFYSLLKSITMEKLNAIDIFSTFTEFIFLFRKNDALRAYEALERLINNARDSRVGQGQVPGDVPQPVTVPWQGHQAVARAGKRV